MKVKINNTVDVSDEQRVQIACVIDQKITKRQATRVECHDYAWSRGSDWALALFDDYMELAQEELI